MGIDAKTIWFDGELIPYADAQVHVMSHTLHYGLGVFEGIRSYTQPDGRAGIWRLPAHLKRFQDSLKMTRLPSPYTTGELTTACLDVLESNELTEAYVRPLAFMGEGKMGLGVRDNPLHVIIATWPWGAYMGEDGMKNGIRMMTSSLIRNHPNAMLQRAKVVGNYVNSIIARYEADDAGFDEALMLDHNGFVAEGTGENVFVVQDGVVLTPPALNILPGVTRQTIIDILKHEGIELREQFFARDAFYTAEEAFMCGTAAEVTPIRELDRRTIGAGRPGPVTRRVQEIYLDAVSGKIDWLRGSITSPSPKTPLRGPNEPTGPVAIA